MSHLSLDDVEVCLSSLSQRNYKAASCSLMIPVRHDNQEAALAVYREAGFAHYSSLRVIGISDLNFLAEFPMLLYLEVIDQPRLNTRYLDCLSNLRGLSIESAGAGIDFTCFAELEVFCGSGTRTTATSINCQSSACCRWGRSVHNPGTCPTWPTSPGWIGCDSG